MAKLAIHSSRDEAKRLTLVKLRGSLDVFSYLSLKDALEAQAAAHAPGRILADLSEVAFIASSGWAVLINFAKSYQRQGGVFGLFALRPEVRGVYETMGIAPVLATYLDQEQAVNAVAPGP